MEYVVKDRTKDFDYYYLYRKKDCSVWYVYQWIILFMFLYNEVKSNPTYSIINGLIGGENP